MGGVLGFQLYVAFHMFNAEGLLGGTIGVSLFRELGPVMASIMVIGRAGAAMAAEISSMRISEQIDALEVMAVDPLEFLVVPRVLAGIVMMPLLAVFFSVVASFAGAGVGCGIMGLDWMNFWNQYNYRVDFIDIGHCLAKAAFFGLVFTSVACFFGYRARGGASGVGYATRTTVVASCLAVLLSDFVLTSFLPFGFTKLRAF